VAKLRAEQAKRLGVDKLKYYDETCVFPDGNADPVGGESVLVPIAQQMYRELSPETGEFFDFLTQYGLYDLETRPGKHIGGYCTYLADYKAPFIFSNFNGTAADVNVLTHEAGHAFAGYTAMRSQPLMDYMSSTSEVNEIHSMTMEHFAYPYLKDFFGEANVEKSKFAHLSGALSTIPYLVSVDEFQHRVYEKPSMSAKERRAVWHEIERTYLPWRDYDGEPFLEEGGFWMQKQHIFLYPFYYVDYALAQVCAFALYGRMKQDRKAAWASYLALCRAGGSKGYFELLALAGLDVPFAEGSVEKAVRHVIDELNA
jgi:M3 family oligoendopeptidase